MFIAYGLNVDYLLSDVRLRIGDLDNKRFSDSIVRTAIVAGVKTLERRWNSRYLVYYKDTTLVSSLPSNVMYATEYNALIAASGNTHGIDTVIPIGYIYVNVPQGYAIIASGLKNNDIFRNPYHTFTDTGEVFSQEDEYPIILVAAIALRGSQLSSSADAFQSWSDGEYSFSNIASSKVMSDLYYGDIKLLDEFFKKRLARPIRESFPAFIPGMIYPSPILF